jgi:uncharacterized protein (DUF305 family)
MRRNIRIAAVLAAATTTLTACVNIDTGTDEPAAGDSATTSSEHNEADVEFATDMIPHHVQALRMADMAEARADSEELRSLAADIEDAQGPEIDLMAGWLESWGEEVPDTDAGHMGMDHGAMGDNMDDLDGDMPGMMSDEELDALGKASGSPFDAMWLRMMIEHHEGAIEMARTEQAEGQNPDAIALAEDIEATQTAEIATMEDMLDS